MNLSETGKKQTTQSNKKEILEEEDTSWFAKAIPESKLESIMWDLEVALLESDVALPVVEVIKESIKKELLGRKLNADQNSIH